MVYSDAKTRFGISFLVALVVGILVYAVLNPFVVWYLGLVPSLITCGTIGVMCDFPVAVLSYGIPLFTLFLGVSSIFEVFLK